MVVVGEEEEEGAAGLGRPQFGISSLFVIHTEKNESRCRSGGEGGRRAGEGRPSKTRLSGRRSCRDQSQPVLVK